MEPSTQNLALHLKWNTGASYVCIYVCVYYVCEHVCINLLTHTLCLLYAHAHMCYVKSNPCAGSCVNALAFFFFLF